MGHICKIFGNNGRFFPIHSFTISSVTSVFIWFWNYDHWQILLESTKFCLFVSEKNRICYRNVHDIISPSHEFMKWKKTKVFWLELKIVFEEKIREFVKFSPQQKELPNKRARTTDTQWRHTSNISEKLGRCGRQNMLRPYLKIWEWEWIFGRAVKAISSLGVRSPWIHARMENNNLSQFSYKITRICKKTGKSWRLSQAKNQIRKVFNPQNRYIICCHISEKINKNYNKK